MADSEIAGLTEDTTPAQDDAFYVQDAAGAVDKRVPISSVATVLDDADKWYVPIRDKDGVVVGGIGHSAAWGPGVIFWAGDDQVPLDYDGPHFGLYESGIAFIQNDDGSSQILVGTAGTMDLQADNSIEITVGAGRSIGLHNSGIEFFGNTPGIDGTDTPATLVQLADVLDALGVIASHTITNPPSSEDIADTVGAMVTGNTETGITVTYQDADNTLDFAVDAQVDDTAYDATSWNGVTTTAPSKNAVRDKIEDILDGVTFTGDISVPDEAYGSGWNASLEVPTKNAVYDKIETMGAGGSVATDTLWDAAGDLAVGSGADTAAKLSKGTAYQVLQVNSGATNIAWGTPRSSVVPGIGDSSAHNRFWGITPEMTPTTGNGTLALTANQLYYTNKFQIECGIRITAVRMNVGTNVAGSTIRIGVVTLGLDDQAASLVSDLGTIDTGASTGIKTITGLTVDCAPGRYGLVFVTSNHTPTMSFIQGGARSWGVEDGTFTSPMRWVGRASSSAEHTALSNPPPNFNTYDNGAAASAYSFCQMQWTVIP